MAPWNKALRLRLRLNAKTACVTSPREGLLEARGPLGGSLDPPSMT
jgi:hypothetical protein